MIREKVQVLFTKRLLSIIREPKQGKVHALRALCRRACSLEPRPSIAVLLDADVAWYDDTLQSLVRHTEQIVRPFAIGANIMHDRGLASWSARDSVAAIIDKFIFLGYGESGDVDQDMGLFMRYVPGGTLVTSMQDVCTFYESMNEGLGHDDVGYSMYLGHARIKIARDVRIYHEWPNTIGDYLRMRSRHIAETMRLKRCATQDADDDQAEDPEEFTRINPLSYAKHLFRRHSYSNKTVRPITYSWKHFLVLGPMLPGIAILLHLVARIRLWRTSSGSAWQR